MHTDLPLTDTGVCSVVLSRSIAAVVVVTGVPGEPGTSAIVLARLTGPMCRLLSATDGTVLVVLPATQQLVCGVA